MTVVQNAAAPSATTKPSRMSLGSLVKGRQQHPIRALLYGPEGVGKSTFGAAAPGAIFLGAEDGTASLDVTRFAAPESWGDLLDAVRILSNEKHEYKTLVIDTLDWAEPLLWAHICARDKQESVESYGYGRGYVAALDEWRVLLAALERMRKASSMHVVMLAHSWIKAFKSPTGDGFDRYELKLHPKASGLLKEWADCVLFSDYEVYEVRDERTKRVRGVDNNGARIIHTERRAAWDAKNRYGLPESMPLSWPDFMAAVEAHQPGEPDALIEAILAKAKQLGGKMQTDTVASLQKIGKDAVKLSTLNNWCQAKLAEKAVA
jgi:hypothetical protein